MASNPRAAEANQAAQAAARANRLRKVKTTTGNVSNVQDTLNKASAGLSNQATVTNVTRNPDGTLSSSSSVSAPDNFNYAPMQGRNSTAEAYGKVTDRTLGVSGLYGQQPTEVLQGARDAAQQVQKTQQDIQNRSQDSSVIRQTIQDTFGGSSLQDILGGWSDFAGMSIDDMENQIIDLEWSGNQPRVRPEFSGLIQEAWNNPEIAKRAHQISASGQMSGLQAVLQAVSDISKQYSEIESGNYVSPEDKARLEQEQMKQREAEQMRRQQGQKERDIVNLERMVDPVTQSRFDELATIPQYQTAQSSVDKFSTALNEMEDVPQYALSAQANYQRTLQSLAAEMNQLKSVPSMDGAYAQFLLSDQQFMQDMDTRGRSMAEKSLDIAVSAAEATKQLMQLQEERNQQARIQDEVAQMHRNKENEIRNRRLVNKTGLNTDSQGLRYIEEERERGAQLLRDLQQEHRTEAAIANTQIALTYQQAIETATQNHDMTILGLDENYQAGKRTLQAQFNQLDERREEFKRSIISNFWNGVREADKAYVQEQKTARKEAETKKLAEQSRIDDLTLNAFDSYKQYIAGDLSRDGARSLMKQFAKLGVDTSGFDMDAARIEDLQAAEDSVASANFEAGLSNYLPVTTVSGRSVAKDIGNLITDLFDSGEAKRKGLAIEGNWKLTLENALKDKDYDRFAEKALHYAYLSAGSTERSDMIEADLQYAKLRQAQRAVEAFKNYSPDGGGFWDEVKNKAYNKIKATDLDLEEYKSMKSAVEAFQATVRNRIFGAALTEFEGEKADQFLINWNKDSLETVFTKMENLEALGRAELKNAYSKPLGGERNVQAILDYISGDSSTLFGDQITPESEDDFWSQYDTASEYPGLNEGFMWDENTMNTTPIGKYAGGEELHSGVFDGREVTLKRSAMTAFNKANAEFKTLYGQDIRIGGVGTSSYRDQKETIRQMASRAGIQFDEGNPNNTAAKLRARGMQVANVGGSAHERGEAIDLYPFPINVNGRELSSHEYISLVKPFLEKYGIKQQNWGGNDPGNFEYSTIS